MIVNFVQVQYNLCQLATLKRQKKMFFATDYCLMQIKSIEREHSANCNTFDLH